MFLLDTNVVSELRRPEKADPGVIRWATALAPERLYISAITVLEIEWGALRIARRDAVQGAMLRDWIEMRLLPSFAGRILPVDAAVVKLCAPMHVPDPMPIYDALIAATALVRGMRVATRDVKDFASMGVKIVNPFDP